MKIYVDDINGIYHPIDIGMEYKDEKLQYSDSKAIRDEDVPADKRTMDVVKDIANSIDEMIVMTTDVPSTYEDGKVPTLDVKVWVEETENKVFYEFYEKPMKNRLILSKSSAMPM